MCIFLVQIIFILCVFDVSTSDEDVVINYCGCNEVLNNNCQTEASSGINSHINLPSSIPLKSNTCPQDRQAIASLDNQIIEWPETESGKYAVSDPLCIDESLKIIKRFCNDDNWDEAPNCKSVQQPINPCPSDLTSFNAIYCFKIIKKTQFPPNCPYPGELGWEKTVDLDIFPDAPVWMPLKRTDNAEGGIDLLRYTEISEEYYKPFQICKQSCLTFFYQDTFLDKQCQVYHNSTHIEAVRCDSEYAAVCIYDALNRRRSSLCSQKYESCKQGGYEAESKCFCKTIEQNVEQQVLAEFLEPYQSLLFKDESCRIGLQNTQDESNIPFKWISSQSNLSYTSWSPNVNFDYKFGLQTQDGWSLSSEEDETCYLYQIDAPIITEGSLSLAIEATYYKLTLKNYDNFLTSDNDHPVVYCFTDADAQSIIYQIPNDAVEIEKSDDDYIVKFSPISLDQSGPGDYWCTAFLYPNLEPVTSERVIMRNFFAEYVVLLKLQQYEEKLSKYPLTSENLQTLQNLFKNELSDNTTFYPRIFKINSIDEINKEINITFHLTSSEASSTLEEFDTLRNITKAQTMFEMLDFRSVLYCPPSITIHGGEEIFWPTIEALSGLSTTYPSNGHCATHDVTLIQRTCSGNFVDGVYWSDVTEMCNYFPKSKLTDTMIEISNQIEDNSALSKLRKLSEKYQYFNTLDVGLAVNFIMRISSKKVDLDVVSATISNLMNIPRVILLSAQIHFKSTDTLLKSIDTMWENGNFGEWNKPNFAVRSINLKTDAILGYQLNTCTASDACVLTPIDNTTELFNKSIIQEQEVTAAISLSTELYQQILNYQTKNESYVPKLIIIFYYGSQLFVEVENSKISNVVFGVLLPEFPQDKLFEGPVSMYYYTDVESKLFEYNCSYWRFNELTTGTWAIEDTEEFAEAIVCEFYHLTNFAVQTTEEELFCTQIKNDYCLTQNFTLIPTTCFENFTGRAHISSISNNCTKYQISSQKMKNALQLFPDNVTYDFIIDLLDSMQSDKLFFSDVELMVVVWLMQKLSYNVNVSQLAVIVDKLIEIPESILSSSQKNFKTTDQLLAVIDESLVYGQNGNWKTDNFIIETFEIDDNHMGIVLENCSTIPDNCDIQFINSNLSMSSNNIYAYLLLSYELYNQIISYSKDNSSYIPKLIVSIYYSSSLFVDMESPDKKTGMVFDVLLPEFEQEFQGPFIIYYFNNSSSTEYNCSYWKFEADGYGSWESEWSANGDKGTKCEFYHLTHFAVNSLSNYANSSDNFYCGSKRCSNNLEINFLEHSSTNIFLDIAYLNFSSHDFLKPSDAVTLELLADMIDETSSFKSSDNLLNNIDRILGNVQETNYIDKENIAFITISKEHAQHFQGFYVTNDKDIACIYQEVNFTYLDFNIAVTLDNELRHQIKEANSNIAFAIFYTNPLFANSKKNNAQLPIVAVLIPKLPSKNLNGNITIKYKTFKNGACSYWHNTKFGFWQQESEADFFHNISTCHFNHVTHFGLVYDLQNITANLQQILDSSLSAREKLLQVISIISSNPNDLVAVDIYLISQIIAESLSEVALPDIITKIISSLFTVPRDVLRESQEVHSATDIILYSVDRMAAKIDDIVAHYCNFSLIVKQFDTFNITGVMLYDCKDYKCKIEILQEFINISDYTNNASINAMVLFSEDLVSQIKNNPNKPKVAISMYYNDALFNEVSLIRNTSQIFGVVFPGLNSDLEGNVSVIINVGNTNATDDINQCAYWYYQPSGNNGTLGQWMNDSREQRENFMSICSYSHVTHLGMLLGNNEKYDNDPILDLVTDIGCILSLFGIIAILFTALIHKKWRQNTGNIILINFSIAIMLKIITLYVSVYLKTTTMLLFCSITGILLHYATLSECAWMLTVAILQFKRFVEVLGGPPKYVLVKALICGWIFPIIPVICVVAIDPNNYQKGFASLCYPSNLGLYLGVWLPMLLILAINCIIFTFIVYNVFHKKTEYIENSNHEILIQWRLALLLFFMLGLNGVFGFLAQINTDGIFIYLYSITASLQGFVLFLFFIVFNKSTRFLYSQSIKQWFYARGMFRLWQQSSKPATAKN